MVKHISKAKVLLSITLVLCLVAVMLPTGIFALVASAEDTTADTWGGTTDIEPFANIDEADAGTEGNPYEIANGAQLYFLSKMIDTAAGEPVEANGKTYDAPTGTNVYEDTYFVLTGDINLGNQPWEPIGWHTSANSRRSFAGTFDGGNYTISNLNCTVIDANGTGLFAAANRAVFKNLTVKGTVTKGDFTGTEAYVGGIVGRGHSDVTFTNCGFEGTADALDQKYVGGLMGYVYSGTVTFTNCWTANGEVKGGQGTGGLLGNAASTATLSFENCYSAMAVKRSSNKHTSIGGLVGFAGNTAANSFKNCHFAGTVTNPKYPICYSVVANSTNVFYLIDAANTTNEGTVATGKTAAEFADGTETGVTALLNAQVTETNGYSRWMLRSGDNYPVFYVEPPKLVGLTVNGKAVNLTTAEIVANVAYEDDSVIVTPTAKNPKTVITVNGKAATEAVALKEGANTITIELSLDEMDVIYTVTVNRASGPWGGTTDIEPFANINEEGAGTKDNPYEIANGAQLAYLSQIANEDTANTSGKYFVLTADINLNDQPWTPIGYHDSNSLTCSFRGVLDGAGHTVRGLNCTSTSCATSIKCGMGLFGAAASATIKNLMVKGTITSSTNGYIGGIVGKAHGALTLTNCAFDGSIVVNSSANNAAYNGGLVGYAYTSAGVTIENCWTDGKVITMKQYSGGLVGYSYSSSKIICRNSYSLMTLKRVSNVVTEADNVDNTGGPGGLIGSGGANVTFSNCYFAGYVNNGCPISPSTTINTIDNFTNVYFKDDSYNTTQSVTGVTITTSRTAAEFADGTVTALLNKDLETPVWATSTKGRPIVSDMVDIANGALSPVSTSIRSKSTSQGIRFKFAISKEALTTQLQEVGVVLAQLTDAEGDIKEALEDDTKLIKYENKDEAPYKFVTAVAYQKGSADSAFVDAGDEDWFAAALVNFRTKAKLENKYIARSYAIFTDLAGNEFIVYSDVIGHCDPDFDWKLSVNDIAQTYYENESYWSQLTEEEKGYVNQIVNGYIGTDWNQDGVLKILTIGNSYSEDATAYMPRIARAAGVQDVVVANLYISGASLGQHIQYVEGTNTPSENKFPWYQYFDANGKRQKIEEYQLVDAVKAENWDFITFQQSSVSSGNADTYDKLDDLIEIVKPLCTNPNVKFAWHMTWAYAGDYEKDAFKYYDYNQMTMYNAIVNAVREKIDPREDIVAIIPNGTAIQNARSAASVGDTLNRDGTHLSYTKGRFIAGLGMIDTLIGINWDNFDKEALADTYESDAAFCEIAIVSVQNAMEKPFEITSFEG